MEVPLWTAGFCSCLNAIYVSFSVVPTSSSRPSSPPFCHHTHAHTTHVFHSVTSNLSQHDKTQNYPQSLWPLFDSGLVQDGVSGERGLMGGKQSQSVRVCGLNAWRQHACSITPTVTFSFIYQTDSEARLAMRHVGLCTLQRWTNRVDRSVMLGYQGASVCQNIASSAHELLQTAESYHSYPEHDVYSWGTRFSTSQWVILPATGAPRHFVVQSHEPGP